MNNTDPGHLQKFLWIPLITTRKFHQRKLVEPSVRAS